MTIRTVEVVTVWAPRSDHDQWRHDYLDLIQIQAQTASRFGHKHAVMTDTETPRDLPTYSIINKVELPNELMHALIAGVIARLQMPCKSHLVFVDVDVLIGRSLLEAFNEPYDLGLTWRMNEKAPVNNGVMYVNREGVHGALQFFQKALSICETHWGGDQEAISEVAAPVPDRDGVIEQRWFGRLAFLSMLHFNCVPKTKGLPHYHRPFAIHFKGDTKGWAREYADKFLLPS